MIRYFEAFKVTRSACGGSAVSECHAAAPAG